MLCEEDWLHNCERYCYLAQMQCQEFFVVKLYRKMTKTSAKSEMLEKWIFSSSLEAASKKILLEITAYNATTLIYQMHSSCCIAIGDSTTSTYLQSISLLLQQFVSTLGSLLLAFEDLLVHAGRGYFRHSGIF